MLRDLLQDNLMLVVCGTAVGNLSAQLRVYYAKPTNKFWATLYQTNLTPVQLKPDEYSKLLDYGIGLTDLVKSQSGMDKDLHQSSYDRDGFIDKIERYQPKYVCFNGKKAAETFLLRPASFGLQQEKIGNTRFYVAPSTSGAANKFWSLDAWKELAFVCKHNSSS